MKKLAMKTRYEVINSIKAVYSKTKTRKEKTEIINSLVVSTDLSRSRVKKLLRESIKKRRRKPGSGRKPIYDYRIVPYLEKLWELSDFASGKRFCAAVNDLLDALIRFNEIAIDVAWEKQIRNISSATFDRLIKKTRNRYQLKGRSTTKPGTLLRKHIPIRLGNDWQENQAGYTEIDLVAHCGETVAGEYINTLCLTDIYSSWTKTRAIINKAQKHTFDALEFIRESLPFPLKGIDSDNGKEFINFHLYNYCVQEDIMFTRSRSYRKNDNCHVEQKNWHVVRRSLGYARLEGQRTVDLMNQYYALLDLRINFFDTHFKLIAKEREGPKIKKRYDGPKTAYRRVLDDQTVSQDRKDRLTEIYLSINPIILKNDMMKLHKEIMNRTVGHDLYDSSLKGDISSGLHFNE